jgi:hypothetical protein
MNTPVEVVIGCVLIGLAAVTITWLWVGKRYWQ